MKAFDVPTSGSFLMYLTISRQIFEELGWIILYFCHPHFSSSVFLVPIIL
jgi:hypothetical protein